MRFFLLSLASAVVVTATANPSPAEKPSDQTPYDPSSLTENYHDRSDHGHGGHHWWDHYYGDDDDDDDDDHDDVGEGRHGKWPSGDRHGDDKKPWTRRGHDEDASPHDRKSTGRDEGGGRYSHGHGRADGGDDHKDGGWGWRKHGSEVESPRDGHSPRSWGGEGKYGDGHHGAGRGDDGNHGYKNGHRGEDEDHWHKDGGRDDGDHGHKDIDHEHNGGHKYMAGGHGDDSDHRHKNGEHGDNGGHGHKNVDRGDNHREDDRGYRHKDADRGDNDRRGKSGGDEGDERGHGYQPSTQGDRNGGEKYSHTRDRDDSPTGNKHKHGDIEGDSQNRHHDGDSGTASVKNIPVAQQLRQDTEAFVSDTLGWVNDIIGEDAASTLVIDTTFSLTKTEFADLQHGPCGDTAFTKVFPVIQKFVTNPQDINVLDSDVKRMAWTPSAACTSNHQSSEVEGGIYASFQVMCASSLLLNVSIASSGSTPTVEGQAVEDGSFFIDVDILNGRIRASDAQGSIRGILENRHYPENTTAVQKDWMNGLIDCAAANQLSVVGVVGGGWTTYMQRTNGSGEAGDYQVAAVGFTESFGFSFPDTDEPAAPDSVPAPSTDTNPVPAPPTTVGNETGAGAIAGSGAAAYVQAGVVCRHSPGSPKVCAGRAIMSQLTSFYHSSTVATASPLTQRAGTVAPVAAIMPVAVAGVLFALACVGVAVVTMRRRSGYSPLPQSQA